MELEALFSAAEDEIEKKDRAILELYETLEKQQDISDSNRKEVLRKTEDYLKNPENIVTVEMKKKKKHSGKGLMNSSF